jgi:hypothetical protein
MESRVITTFDEFLKLEIPWGELHKATNGSIFQLHDWLTLWWKTYGVGRTLSIQTFWNDRFLVGIIPGFLEKIRVGPISLRRMSLLGEEEIYGEYYPLTAPEFTEAIAQPAAAYWIREFERGHVDVLDFHGFPPGSEFMEALIVWLRVGARVRLIKENLVHTVVQGPTTGEEYMMSMSGKRRQVLRRHERLLKKAGAEIEVVKEWGQGKPFDDLVRLHEARWMREGQTGRFGSPRFTGFIRDVTERLMGEGKASIYFMRSGSERVAGLLRFDVNRQMCPYLVGRDPDHALMRHSVGEVLMMRAAVDAFDEGSLVCDLLGGDYHHKHYKGMTKLWYARATVAPAGMRGAKGLMYWGTLATRDALVRLREKSRRSQFDNREEPEVT